MKFKDKHRSDILDLMQGQGLEKSDYSFVKRKGRIIIKHHGGSTFSFYKKDDFDIDMNTKKRIDLSEYELKTNSDQKQIVRHWADVLRVFSKWIDELS